MVADFRSERKKKSDDEAACQKEELKRQREESRAKKREQITALRQLPSHMAGGRSRTRQRTPDEIEAARQRGLDAKARFDANQRERKLAAIERQAEIQRNKELAAQRRHQFKLRQMEEAAKKRELDTQQKQEIQRQIVELAKIERSRRLQNDADRRVGKLVFDGADALLTFCKLGLLTDEQSQSLVRIDVDPDLILGSLKSIASMQPDQWQAAVANFVGQIQGNYGNIPETEHFTRWSIRAASELCRRESQELTTDNISQSLFFSLESEDDDTAWLDGESAFERSNSNIAVG